MIARLILVLMLAFAAAPAPVAALARDCHQATSAEDHGAAHHRAPARDEAAQPHACPGCVPPSDWLRERVAGPSLVSAPPRVERAPVLAIGSGVPPALPPPRKA